MPVQRACPATKEAGVQALRWTLHRGDLLERRVDKLAAPQKALTELCTRTVLRMRGLSSDKVPAHFCCAVKFKTVRDFVYEIQRTNRVHRNALPKARFSRSAVGDQLWAASSELTFCEQLTTKRCVIWATFAARGIRTSSKNFSVSSALRRCLRTTGEIA